jgi:hypothetical protein
MVRIEKTEKKIKKKPTLSPKEVRKTGPTD